ncbi:MAG: hypothetical protein ABII85_03795 [Bacillota bacterium]
MKKMIILIIVLFLCGCTSNKPDFTMSAPELSTLYDDNEIEASLTYDDKTIRVDGYVSNIYGNKNEVNITMYPDVIVLVNDKIEDTVDIEDGAYLVVQGTLGKDMYGRSTLYDSTIIEFENLPDAKYSMSIEDFINELEENEELTKEKYLYSFIEITGKAYENWYGGDYITVSVLDHGGGGNIEVYFTDPIVDAIQNNSEITIVGLFVNYNSWGDFSTFEYCRLVD